MKIVIGFFFFILMTTMQLFAFDPDRVEYQIGLYVGTQTASYGNSSDFNNTYMPGGNAGMVFSAIFASNETTALIATVGASSRSLSPEYSSLNSTYYELLLAKDFSGHRFGIGASFYTGFRSEDDNNTFTYAPELSASVGGVLSYTYMFDDDRSLLWLIMWPLYFIDYVGIRYEYIYFEDTVNANSFDASTINFNVGVNFFGT